MNYELTHIDLFSGIGGFSIAARNAGFRTIGFSEVEPYACRVLAERFPGVPNLGDVRKCESFARLGAITVLTAGYPCQPESTAGLRRGKEDYRWLWPAVDAILPILRPAWFIGENVSNHVNMGLDQVLSDLEHRGYSAQPIVIPAAAVGAGHIRERVWIFAYANGDGRQKVGDKKSLLPEAADAWDSGFDATSLRQTVWGCSRPDGAEPLGMGNGIPNRAHRLKGLGNAIVPQVVEPFFHWIAQIERGEIT